MEPIVDVIIFVLRFLFVDIMLHWSPVRIVRMAVFGHDVSDRESGFAESLFWGILDIASWAALILGIVVLWRGISG